MSAPDYPGSLFGFPVGVLLAALFGLLGECERGDGEVLLRTALFQSVLYVITQPSSPDLLFIIGTVVKEDLQQAGTSSKHLSCPQQLSTRGHHVPFCFLFFSFRKSFGLFFSSQNPSQLPLLWVVQISFSRQYFEVCEIHW